MRKSHGFGVAGCLTVAFIFFNTRMTELEDLSANKFEKTESGAEVLQKNGLQTHRYVTPSLAELGGRGNFPEMSDHMLMLTRIPGSGSEILVLILQRLQGYNVFKHIRLPRGDDGILTTLQQELLVEEITNIIKEEAVPLSFDGDVRFLNFSAFGRQAPTFLSIVRDPLDPKCLKRYRKENAAAHYRGAISHFCGQDPRCTYVLGYGGYKLHTVATTWNEARHICEFEGSYLCIINSEKEAKVVSDYFRVSDEITGSYNETLAFLGIHGFFGTGDWVTVFGQSIQDAGYNFSNDTEEGDINSTYKKCGGINQSGYLEVLPCGLPFGFICEQPYVPVRDKGFFGIPIRWHF